MKAEVHNLCTNVYCVIISLLNSKKLQSTQTKIVELRSGSNSQKGNTNGNTSKCRHSLFSDSAMMFPNYLQMIEKFISLLFTINIMTQLGVWRFG